MSYRITLCAEYNIACNGFESDIMEITAQKGIGVSDVLQYFQGARYTLS